MPEQRVRIRHDLLSVEQATKMSGLTRPSIVKRILEGAIGAEKIAQWYFVDRADVEQLARERADSIASATAGHEAELTHA